MLLNERITPTRSGDGSSQHEPARGSVISAPAARYPGLRHGVLDRTVDPFLGKTLRAFAVASLDAMKGWNALGVLTGPVANATGPVTNMR